MNAEQTLPIKFAECVEFIIPEFDTRPALQLAFTKTSVGEKRLVEAQAVNGATYNELEFIFNEGYREAKTNLSVVGYEILKVKKTIRGLKSIYLLDEYPTFLKEKKLNDNTANREGFLERQKDYVEAMDRVDMLVALEHLLEGKIKVFENVCRYMRKEIDIQIRGGMVKTKFTT